MSLLTSYPPSGIEVCEPEEAEGNGRPVWGRAGRRARSRLPAYGRSGRTQLCHRPHTWQCTLSFDSELSQSRITAGVGNSPGANTRSSGAWPPGARSKFSLRFISDRKVQRMRLFRSSVKHRLLATRARSKAHSLM